MKPRRGPVIAMLVVLAVGAGLVYGGFSKYADQTSGVAGKARVTHCQAGFNTKYSHQATRCTGSWTVGGDIVFGNGKVAVGLIDGADTGDEGKTIDVRIHGTDHATVPDIKPPILLWALGGVIALLALWGLSRQWRPRTRARPAA